MRITGHRNAAYGRWGTGRGRPDHGIPNQPGNHTISTPRTLCEWSLSGEQHTPVGGSGGGCLDNIALYHSSVDAGFTGEGRLVGWY